MKMIVAVLKDEDAETAAEAIAEIGLHPIRLPSSGGFLRRKSSTLLIGTIDDRVEEVIRAIRQRCAPSIEPTSTRATLFVLDVAHYEQR